MALYHFAKLDDNNLVLGGLVVDGADCNNGDEATGITFLKNLTGWSKWKKYNPDVDRGFEIGGIYDEASGDFKPQQPSEGHVWNSEYKLWISPEDQAAGNLPE